ncbi:Hypothetical protein SAMN06314042_11023 [Epsilonproteobacteria bacterium SCGC AD-308-O04]|jgi:hypothetical protein|nr:Hypothetical protein SAMN06314042_11023 [Epsilonproteobacteria bacterium SCGC AD-308-O04]
MLIKVEDKDKTHLSLCDFEEYDNFECSYHAKLLFELNLIDGYISKVIRVNHPDDFCIKELTWEGHEFLDSIREEKIWKIIQNKLKDGSISVTFEILKSVAKKALNEYFTSS